MHLTGGYAPRFQAFFLAQAGSVKAALPRPSRQQVAQAVRQEITVRECVKWNLYLMLQS